MVHNKKARGHFHGPAGYRRRGAVLRSVARTSPATARKGITVVKKGDGIKSGCAHCSGTIGARAPFVKEPLHSNHRPVGRSSVSLGTDLPELARGMAGSVLWGDEAAVSTPARVTRVRWLVCALLFAATTINYIDRQILSLLKPMLDTRRKPADAHAACPPRSLAPKGGLSLALTPTTTGNHVWECDSVRISSGWWRLPCCSDIPLRPSRGPGRETSAWRPAFSRRVRTTRSPMSRV